MNDKLSTSEAIKFLSLDKKLFENYFKNGYEFKPLSRINKGRYYFDKVKLQEWKKDYISRSVKLTRDDYNQCLDFALAVHFKSYVLSDFGSGRQREFGQKITNWVKGQLGEVAVKKYIKKMFGLNVKLDFNIYNKIVPQDIILIEKNGKDRVPKLGVSIKSSKPKNIALVLGQNEIEIPNRSSDIYIFCRPDLADDHLLRITNDEIRKSVKLQQHYSSYKDEIPSFSDITCEIAGFCYKKELKKVTEIPGQIFDNGYRYVKYSGQLHRSKEDWKKLLFKL